MIFSMGQVSETITYAFSGTYLAVVFAETYWAAEVVVTIDDTEYGSFTPHNASVEKETPGDSKVIFVKDDLAEGDHVVTITHKTAYTLSLIHSSLLPPRPGKRRSAGGSRRFPA